MQLNPHIYSDGSYARGGGEEKRERGASILCLIVFLSEGKRQSPNYVFFVGERGVVRSWNLEDVVE